VKKQEEEREEAGRIGRKERRKEEGRKTYLRSQKEL